MSKVIESIKKIYPEINGGFVYWESKYDGTALEHPIQGLIWENTEFPKPTWEQIEAQFDNVELNEKKLTKISQCKTYLNQTDWYIIRMSDPSNSSIVPENILINRANARTWQNDIDNCETLEALNAINIIWQ